jgi:hypothetical protein
VQTFQNGLEAEIRQEKVVADTAQIRLHNKHRMAYVKLRKKIKELIAKTQRYSISTCQWQESK